MPQFIATCPPGFEYLLVDELKSLQVNDAKEGLTQVIFEADWPTLYRVCLWTRLANRILYPIANFNSENEDELYDNVRQVPWEVHLSEDSTFAVDFVSRRSRINHDQFGALKVKDAVVDYFRDEFGSRPSVDTHQPDVRLHCRVNKNLATLCIDLSGSGLHQRGYRKQTGEAPLKENFAAALLYRAGWHQLENNSLSLSYLLDPMCGSGTLVIEAAMIAFNIAPGLQRDYWGFKGWKPFQPALWETAVTEANNAKELALETISKPLLANDKDPQVLAIAKENATRAGVESLIEWQVGLFQQINRPDVKDAGLVITNPPYGERLEDSARAQVLYSELGSWLREHFKGDVAAILSTQKEHGHALNIRAEKIYRFKNGPIDCELLKLNLLPENFVDSRRKDGGRWDENLSDSARMLANRLQKNLASLKSFINQQQLTCFRLYDADLPEFAAAIDVYQDALHIQEYAPPKNIDKHKALRRLRDIERVAAGVLEIEPERVFVKTRMRQKGETQYRRQDEQRQILVVEEGNCRFEVNLSDYLDTGLFLDHRKIRQQMAQWLKPGMSFLNLFCYTGAASVHAAKAGAKTMSVDLSNTYLDWAKRNFILNDLTLSEHEFIRADTMEWLERSEASLAQSFDVIFIDPPTFSNSKKMEQHFDVQQAHQTLLDAALALLKPGGQLVFSNNFRKFEMTFEPPADVTMKEITRETTSRDFSRKPLHRCWLLKKA